ncbi:conserved hypothetical protein [Sphingomonas sp. EC-HK361]|uniref:hydrolase 1, exosortase A system-associated n=1 Tax=Sphingomonas sp. EC-HK361 TaxID=2038397 RepID=UPI00125ABE51|nr:hydrolase 1, exosortase A system-associated [Sphingomonas sp. EC-HK361]VVT03792.1 conserved hypothetical protein [Sphingomonas sp. EC-HK361]
MRRLIAFSVGDDTLVGTLDTAEGQTGLLIVSGGDEIRSGAHRGMAMLADSIAEAGFPVFRFDRRGIGDSTGENTGYGSSVEDIAAALNAFRSEASEVTRIVGFGLCDAATALAMFGAEIGIDAFILANPFVEAGDDDLPPASAIRARYAEKLREPKSVGRLLTGGVSFGKLRRGLGSILSSHAQDLADDFAAALDEANRPTTIILTRGDATAIAFETALSTPAFASIRDRARIIRIAGHSHSFARPSEAEALTAAIITALEKAGQRA